MLAAALIVPATAPAPVAAGDRAVSATEKMRTAEARLLRDINRIRVRNGRKPLRLDKPTRAVARARSTDMAAKRYFAHVEPDGDNARRILRRRDIPASEVTENIGHTFGLTLREGSRRMAKWWYHSPPHRRQMLARNVNYVGIGIARKGSRFTYTAVFTRSRDKTSPRVVIDEVMWQPTGTGAKVTLEWHGVDPKLAKGTAGIRRYDVELQRETGGWHRLDGGPRRSVRSVEAADGDDQRFRVRAVDKAGNVGPWAYTSVDIPHLLPRWI
mgnify:CR=1 FL=1